MPIQPYRTRSLARVKKKTPKGRIVIHYIKRKPAKAKCAICKKPLLGVPNLPPNKLRKLSKTQKRPERPYGGYLCPSCLKKKILQETKNITYKKIEPGRLVIKLAGREAGKLAVIIERVDDNFVIIDGQVKKRKCNINHLATLDKKMKITKTITKQDLKKEFKNLGYEIKTTKPKPKKEKPKQLRLKKIKETQKEKKKEKKKKTKIKETKKEKKKEKKKETKK